MNLDLILTIALGVLAAWAALTILGLLVLATMRLIRMRLIRRGRTHQ